MRSNWLFRRTLTLYPRELRERFGDEMELVFEELMEDAWRMGGALGVARAWRYALAELVTVALPSRLAPAAVPAIAVLTALVYFVGMIGLIPLAHAR